MGKLLCNVNNIFTTFDDCISTFSKHKLYILYRAEIRNQDMFTIAVQGLSKFKVYPRHSEVNGTKVEKQMNRAGFKISIGLTSRVKPFAHRRRSQALLRKIA